MTKGIPRAHRRGLMVLGVLALVTTAFFAPMFGSDSNKKYFCTLGLSIGTANDETVALEDQHSPGRVTERCGDGDRNGTAGMNTLGFDCKIRDARGTVVGTTTPNRQDGTCGQLDR